MIKLEFLIVKTSSLGDLLQTFPVVASLKKAFPTCTIDWVVEKAGARLLEAHPDIDRVIVLNSKKWKKAPFSHRSEIRSFKETLQKKTYDLLFDLQGNTKSACVTYLAKALRKVGFGRKSVPEWPNLLVTNEKYDPPKGNNRRLDYLYMVEQALEIKSDLSEKVSLELTEEEEKIFASLPKLHTLVAPGSAWKNKTLPRETMLAFLQKLEGPFLFSYGNEDEKKEVEFLAEALDGTVLPKLSLPLLQRVMGECRLVISADSLPLHLAGTAGTPTFSFFGPSSQNVYRPLGENHRSVQGHCSLGVTFDKRCKLLRTCKSAPCINQLNAETLIQRLKDDV